MKIKLFFLFIPFFLMFVAAQAMPVKRKSFYTQKPEDPGAMVKLYSSQRD